MPTSLNTMLLLYRNTRKQRYTLISLQLEQLTASITQALNRIAQQEQAWLSIESMTLGSFQSMLTEDARILLKTKDFQAFLERLGDKKPDLPRSTIAAMTLEPQQWQLATLTDPLQIKRFHLAIERRTCRMQLNLGAWQHWVEIAVASTDCSPCGDLDQAWYLNLLEQLENFELNLDQAQTDQLRHELTLLLAYLLPLICICPITSEFVYQKGRETPSSANGETAKRIWE